MRRSNSAPGGLNQPQLTPANNAWLQLWSAQHGGAALPLGGALKLLTNPDAQEEEPEWLKNAEKLKPAEGEASMLGIDEWFSALDWKPAGESLNADVVLGGTAACC